MSGADPASHAVRIRGIYTTALTRLFLDAGWMVVDASEPIRRRFDTEFDATAPTISAETTADRQGVGVQGTPTAVDEAAALLSVGIDTLSWEDAAPVGSVIDGKITDTRRRGALVDLGTETGYLPFRNTDDHVDVGEMVRVQVRESAAPWTDDRPLLDTDIRVSTGLATLLPESGTPTVSTRDAAAARELVGMTELLGVEAPDGWRIQWEHAATEASMDVLKSALNRAVVQADTLAGVLDDAPPAADRTEPTGLFAERAGRWFWFGRESRFVLDGLRRSVTTTLPGHHRIKTGADAASAGVDLAEALCGSDWSGETSDEDGIDTFPFSVVADCFGPSVGDQVDIGHGTPDGRLISLGSGTVTDRDDDSVTLQRELSGGGSYDALDIPRKNGDIAVTTFREGRWWYPTVYRRDDDVLGTYVNICTPVECFPDSVRYVDLHVDVIKHGDGRVERVDDDELEAAVDAENVHEALAEKARSVASALETAL